MRMSGAGTAKIMWHSFYGMSLTCSVSIFVSSVSVALILAVAGAYETTSVLGAVVIVVSALLSWVRFENKRAGPEENGRGMPIHQVLAIVDWVVLLLVLCMPIACHLATGISEITGEVCWTILCPVYMIKIAITRGRVNQPKVRWEWQSAGSASFVFTGLLMLTTRCILFLPNCLSFLAAAIHSNPLSQHMQRVVYWNLLGGATLVCTIVISGLNTQLKHAETEDWGVLRYFLMSINFLVTSRLEHAQGLARHSSHCLILCFVCHTRLRPHPLTHPTFRFDRGCQRLWESSSAGSTQSLSCAAKKSSC